MIFNDEDIKDLEKYTFKKYLDNNYNSEKFSKIISFPNKCIYNYQYRNINNKDYNDKEKVKNKNNNSNNRDINYNQMNINNYYQKIPLAKNLHNINNFNIISKYKYSNNFANNYNNININNGYKNKRHLISKENNENRKKYKTPDKYLNYNNFNFINPYDSERRNNNYNENFTTKNNIKKIRKALTPDNTNNKNNRNFKNIRKNRLIPTNTNSINNLMIINFKNDSNNNFNNNFNISMKFDKKDNINSLVNNKNDNYTNSFKISEDTFSKTNNNENNNYDLKNKYNPSNSIIDKAHYYNKFNSNAISKDLNNRINYNNSYLNLNKNNPYLKYKESSFNNRLLRGSKLPMINKYIEKYNFINKTPSPIRNNNNYIRNSIYNSKIEKNLKYTRSASYDNGKKKYSKLKTDIFKLKKRDLNFRQEAFLYNNKNSNLTDNIIKQYKVINNKKYNYNIINSSYGHNNSSIIDNKNYSNSFNEKFYNMTQPEFTKSIYASGNINQNNNNFYKNSIKELNLKNSSNESQTYNYKSYIESYNNESIKDSSNNNYKSEISNFNKYINLSNGNSYNKKNTINNYITKLSTNNNTYDENNNRKMDTIEEVHLNFVKILHNTKNMIKSQENSFKDKIIYNSINSSIIIVEERELD